MGKNSQRRRHNVGRHRRPRGLSFTEQGRAVVDLILGDLENTESGREALALGQGWGSALVPCPTHGVIDCRPCGRRIMRLTELHHFGLPPDDRSCLFIFEAGNRQDSPCWEHSSDPDLSGCAHICFIEGDDEFGHHDGPHSCGRCGDKGLS